MSTVQKPTVAVPIPATDLTPTELKELRAALGVPAIDLISADNGDANVTLTVGSSLETERWNTPLTADRTVTLSTTGALNGSKFTVMRESGATGPFKLVVGSLKTLDQPSSWATFGFDGTAWKLVDSGSTVSLSAYRFPTPNCVVATFPTQFTTTPLAWTPPFQIWQDVYGKFYPTVIARDLILRSGYNIYVDQANGNDANDGSTWALAFASVKAALMGTRYTSTGTYPANIPVTIYIRAGRYDYSQSIGNQPFVRPTNLIAVEPYVEFSGGYYGDRVTWTDESGTIANTWSTPLVATTGTTIMIFDKQYVDAWGCATNMTRSSSLANVGNTGSRYYVSGNRLYVNTLDHRKPDQSVAFSLLTGSDVNKYDSATSGSNSLYCEGINFLLGDHAFHSVGTAGGNIIMNSCDFFGGGNKGAECEMSNATTQTAMHWFENCTFRRNLQDGISGRGNARIVEVNSRAHRNGWLTTQFTDGSSNGTTAHSSSRFVRINCQYIQNQDRNVHDIELARSFNIGCTSADTLAWADNDGPGPYDSCNWVIGVPGVAGTGYMWLYRCNIGRQRGATVSNSGDYGSYGTSEMYIYDSPAGVVTKDVGAIVTTFVPA